MKSKGGKNIPGNGLMIISEDWKHCPIIKYQEQAMKH
jgi:hypothetical protein